MSIDDTFNFRRIDERVTTSGLVSAAQLSTLRDEGYAALINLLPDSSEYAVADEARILSEQGIDYVYIPVDFEAPTHADFEAFIDAMDRRSGQKIHVHCAANYRVSAFYSLYALRRGWYDEDAANALVESIWTPSDFPAWTAFLTNERA
jgi:protein tyrosine phosphatase (PTP) superfamily phosphohydrolase (DUF442 family)